MSGFTVRFLFIYNIFMKSALHKRRKQIIVLAALYVLGMVFFMTTSPADLPLLLLVAPFIYIFVVLYLTVLFLCQILKVRQAKVIAMIISVFGVLLFLLGSLHQLTLRDALISLALTVTLTWYITRVSNR